MFINNGKKPVIGILTLPVVKKIVINSDNTIKSYLDNNYVEWLKLGGADVVPIPYNWSQQKILMTLNQVNGVLFPGGSVDRRFKEDFLEYIEAFEFILNYATKRSDFSIWATCLGFEFLMLLTKYSAKYIFHSHISGSFKNSPNMIIKATSEGETKPLRLLDKSFLNNPMFSNFDDNFKNDLKTPCIFMSHHWGIPYNDYNYSFYSQFLTILSTNTSDEGNEYISTIKFNNYPFFGVQWHPEKPLFEYGNPKVPHTQFSKYLSYSFVTMFVESCKRNQNQLRDTRLLIDNYTLSSRDIRMKQINIHSSKGKDKKYYFFN